MLRKNNVPERFDQTLLKFDKSTQGLKKTEMEVQKKGRDCKEKSADEGRYTNTQTLGCEKDR